MSTLAVSHTSMASIGSAGSYSGASMLVNGLSANQNQVSQNTSFTLCNVFVYDDDMYLKQ